MSTNKMIAEAALSCMMRLKDLPVYEKYGVVALMNTLIAVEAKAAEIDRQSDQGPSLPTLDEHYRQ